jgi:hypothetical protein
MRQLVLVTAILTGALICLVGSGRISIAAPMLFISAPTAAQSLAENAGWRRYCRRYGCGPDVVVPDVVAPDTGVDVEVDADAGPPAVIVLPPPRPLSCGQYRYWNGDRCVDARYHDPYLGPR